MCAYEWYIHVATGRYMLVKCVHWSECLALCIEALAWKLQIIDYSDKAIVVTATDVHTSGIVDTSNMGVPSTSYL